VRKVTKETERTTSTKRQVPVSVGILIALMILGLYLLQITGILDLGLFDYEEELLPAGGEWIQVYFTAPKYPNDQADHKGGLDEILAADIETAESTVDVAAYELDLESVGRALVAAHERGVQVRFVTDSDNVDERAVRQLVQAGIPVVEDDRGAIMHNKFVVIDSEVVWTGSWNLTENGTYRNNNNAVRIVSAALAENYTTEFEEMFVDRAFGPTSASDTPHPEVLIARPGIGEPVRIDNYFAPEDGVLDRILELVEGARESIRFMAFSFTDDRLGEALKQQSKAGIEIQGVFEARGSDTEYSEYGRLSRARPPLDVLTDGNPYILHHKVMIVDDKIVILGSFNFSESANELNDENVLIIYDDDVAALYRAEFERMYQRALEAGD
jgi:phosphatidylserine/phosphatidylglycerophosphate/cardiolipin synthase-like enzyme